jgi:hypothetical protein
MVLLGSFLIYCLSINYTSVQVWGKVWVGTIIDFCACKNMFTCPCRCKVSTRIKTRFYAFSFAIVRFLHLLKHVSMPLLWRRMVERMLLHGLSLLPRRAQYPLLWRHRIPAPSTGGTRPPPSQSMLWGELIHKWRHVATPHRPVARPPNGGSTCILPSPPPNGTAYFDFVCWFLCSYACVHKFSYVAKL